MIEKSTEGIRFFFKRNSPWSCIPIFTSIYCVWISNTKNADGNFEPQSFYMTWTTLCLKIDRLFKVWGRIYSNFHIEIEFDANGSSLQLKRCFLPRLHQRFIVFSSVSRQICWDGASAEKLGQRENNRCSGKTICQWFNRTHTSLGINPKRRFCWRMLKIFYIQCFFYEQRRLEMLKIQWKISSSTNIVIEMTTTVSLYIYLYIYSNHMFLTSKETFFSVTGILTIEMFSDTRLN